MWKEIENTKQGQSISVDTLSDDMCSESFSGAHLYWAFTLTALREWRMTKIIENQQQLWLQSFTKPYEPDVTKCV